MLAFLHRYKLVYKETCILNTGYRDGRVFEYPSYHIQYYSKPNFEMLKKSYPNTIATYIIQVGSKAKYGYAGKNRQSKETKNICTLLSMHFSTAKCNLKCCFILSKWITIFPF